jgi:hypothetical protein
MLESTVIPALIELPASSLLLLSIADFQLKTWLTTFELYSHEGTQVNKKVKTWKEFCGKYQRAGPIVYQTVSTDIDQILAKLILCNDLNGGKNICGCSKTEPEP